MTNPSLPDDNRRGKPRVSVLIEGVIELRSGTKFTCTIRDLSRSGARLTFAQAEQLPKRFFLWIGRASVSRAVVVQWCGKTEVGVQFTE